MAVVKNLRAAGTTIPVGAQLYPGQIAVNEERMYVGLYNSTDVLAAPWAIAMIGKANIFTEDQTVGGAGASAQRTITVPALTAGGTTVTGTAVTVSDGSSSIIHDKTYIQPSADHYGGIGTPSKRFAGGYFDVIYLSGTISSNTQAVTKEWVENLFNANDAMVFKGTIGPTIGVPGTLPTTGYSAGWTYRVVEAGTYAGKACEINDIIMCISDYGSGFLDGDWTVMQNNIDGAVIGPASSVTGEVAFFSGSTGKLINHDTGLTFNAATDALTAGSYIGAWAGTAIGVAYGGTNITSYAIGDLIYASAATTLAKLADVATGNVLLSGGVGVAPAWGKVALASAVSGTLPAANGGTGVSNSYTLTITGANKTLAGAGSTITIGASPTINGSGTITLTSNALFTTGLTVQTGAVTLTGNAAGSTLVLPSGSFTLSALTSGHVLYASAANIISGEASLALTRGGTGKTSIAIDKMWYASAANVLSEVATTTFGRGLLAAVADTLITDLYADRAATLFTNGTPSAGQVMIITSGAWNNPTSSSQITADAAGKLTAVQLDGLIDCGTWA